MSLYNYRRIACCIAVLLFLVTEGTRSGYTRSLHQSVTKLTDPVPERINSGAKERITFQTLPRNFEYDGVQCILKDYKGYMWFGTGDGLIRFDGINLRVYENDPDDSTSLTHNGVNALVEDINHNLWVGTTNGLNLYNREQDNFVRVGKINQSLRRLNNNYISSLCLDSNSLLWIGTFGDGINVYDPEKQSLKHYSYDPDNPRALSSNRIVCMVFDEYRNLWIGTQNGLNLLSDNSGYFSHFFEQPGDRHSLGNNNVTSMVRDTEGNLWIATRGGGVNKLSRQNNQYTFKTYDTQSAAGRLSSNYILSLETDNRGFLWIGTENGGLDRLKINSDSVRIFQVEEGNKNSISSNSIWSLYSDNEDRLWIGTYNKGINVIDKKYSKFESYQRNLVSSNGLTDDDVRGFTEDDRGNIWIATDGGGICRFDPQSHKFNRLIFNTKEHNYLSNNAIQCILFDSKENLWIGTWAGGIDRLDKNGRGIISYKVENAQGGGNNNIFSICEDSRGNIWAGTAGSGLFKFDPVKNSFVQILCKNPSGILTKSAYVTSIFEESEGSLWIGTLNGIVILNNSDGNNFNCTGFTHRQSLPSLSSNSVIVIFEDSRHRMWVGTEDKGLNLFNRKDSTFTTYQKNDGMPSNSIRGILEDDKGYLWITTNKGICRFDDDSSSFTNYTTEDGLNSNKFYARSSLKSKSGEFYFGGENGFNAFYPQNIRKNNFIPPVYLTNFKINNVAVKTGAENSPLKKIIGETSEITLSYKQNSFTIEFVALNYTRSLKNEFEYKLEGFDDDWNFTGNVRSATYTNIKPGHYEFLVKGSNNDGIWNNSPAHLMITIDPPYWKTWWAKLIYLIILFTLLGTVYKISNERIKIKNQLKLEQLGREKEHELNEMNIQFFTNISHEFRTPLSLIIAPLESIINSPRSKLKGQLQVVYQNAQRLLQLTNDLMDFRKLEEGLTTLKVKYGDILNFIMKVATYFDVNAKRHHIDFTIETTEPGIHGWFDPEKLETILLNLMSNAFRHTNDSIGRIKIVVNYTGIRQIEANYTDRIIGIHQDCRYIEISVTDNGSGINREELPYIFDKYYQTKLSGNGVSKGTGIGLTLTRGLVELHHGSIKAESVPDKETRFSFILPVDRTAYAENELVTEPADFPDTIVLNKPDGIIFQTFENELTEPNTVRNKDAPQLLIVEDNFELRNFLARELGETFNVTQAEDGIKGTELAFEKIPDLIVSDILMPGCSGIEFCKLIKTDIRTCHIPVILLTAKTTVNDQIEGVEVGADAYINKPFNMKYLLVQINQLIQSRQKLYARFSQDVYLMPNKLTNNDMDQEFLQRAIDYIVENISDNNLNVEELSEALNLSRSNVYRKIKALTGMTIIEFIRIIRLKQALKLMETKKYSLSEIAYQTGFSSPSYFTKSFKDQYGKPPSEYLP